MTRKNRRNPKRVNKNISYEIKNAWNQGNNQVAPMLHWTIRKSNNNRKVRVEIILTPDGTNSGT